MSLLPLDLMSSVSQTKCVCRSWAAGLLWEMMELAWQEFQETLVWSHSVRCSIHGHEQPLVWRIYNHDAAAVPVFMFALIISSDVLFIVNLTLLHTCQCFSLIAKLQSIALQILNSFLLKSGSRRECTKEWELVRCPVWGERWSNFLQQVRKTWLLSSLRILLYYPLWRHGSLRR